MIIDDDDERWPPALAVMLACAIFCAVLFWLPLFLYVTHWWLG